MKHNGTNFDYEKFYLIVLTINEANETTRLDTMRKIFDLCWRFYILNINMIVEDFPLNSAQLYTYFPFTESNCNSLDPIQLDHNLENIYPDKLKNMFGCPIYVASVTIAPNVMIIHHGDERYSFDGIEGKILMIMSQRLNFRPVGKIPADGKKWGTIYPNGTVTGAMRMMIDYEVNITMGAFGLQNTRRQIMDYIITLQTTIGFIIPPGKPYTSFKKLFLPLSTNAWLLIAITFTVGFIVIAIMKYAGSRIRNFVIGQRNTLPYPNMLNIFLGGTISRIPNRNFARYLLMLWMILTLIIRSLYQGGLFTYLERQVNSSNPDTVPALIKENFVFYLGISAAFYLELMPELLGHVVLFEPNERDEIFETLRDPNSRKVFVTTKFQIAYLNSINYQQGIYLSVRENYFMIPLAIYTQKASYLTPKLTTEMSEYLAVGIVTHWIDKFVDRRFEKVRLTQTPMKLRFDHISGCLYMCLMFLFISSLVFLLEVFSQFNRRLRRVLDYLTYE